MSTIDFDKFNLEGLSLEDIKPVEDMVSEELEPVKAPQKKAEVAKKPQVVKIPQSVNEAAVGSETTQSSEDQMTCPKCEMIQPKAEQCMGCGVYVKKAQAMMGQSKIQITSTKF